MLGEPFGVFALRERELEDEGVLVEDRFGAAVAVVDACMLVAACVEAGAEARVLAR